MHFKRLELYGFKSFAEKTVLNFEPGVTAIVGPNGCGKSNIADAVRWVLGEQSAKALRGSKMEDIIFNGAGEKDSLSMAEVSLTLSNSSRILPIDYNEVTMSRKIFRSGESQYFLNKTQVRLKDIVELFMGTGIGTNTYSLIEQGKIDLILSSKPEERRFIFEEAAGITKYKAKRKEALRKLEETESNLVRLNDVIAEVKRQINSIDRQAAKARRYKETFDELKNLDIQYTFAEYNGLKVRMEELDKKLKESREKENTSFSTMERFRAEVAEQETRLADADKLLADIQNKKLDLTLQSDRNTNQILLNKERIEEIVKRNVALKEELESFQERNRQLKETIENLKKGSLRITEDLAGKKSDLSGLEKSIAALDGKVKENEEIIAKSKISSFETSQDDARLKNELTKVSVELNNHQIRLRRLKSEGEDTRQELEQIESRLSFLAVNLKKTTERLKELEGRKKETRDTITSREELRAELNRKILRLKEKVEKASSRLEYLEELKAKREGFSRGVREILKQKELGNPIFLPAEGTIYDLIQIDSGFGLAVEAALGNLLEAVVVEKTGQAKAMLAHLKEKGLGKAAFLIVELIKEESSRPAKGGFHPVLDGVQLKRVSEVVKVAEKFKPAILSLLKDTFIAKGIDDGLKAVKEDGGESLCLVTLDGEIITAGGLVSGGKEQEYSSSGLISRDYQLKQLRAEIESGKSNMHALEKEESLKEKEIEEAKKQFVELEENIRNQNLSLASEQSDYNQTGLQKKRIEEELSLVEAETEETNDENSKLLTKKETIEKQLQELQKRGENLRGLMEKSQAAINIIFREREDLLSRVSRLNLEITSLEERKRGEEERLGIYTSSLSEQSQGLIAREGEVNQGVKRNEDLKAQISALEKSQTTLKEEQQQVVSKLEKLQAERTALIAYVDKIEKQLKEKQAESDETKNNARDYELNKTEIYYNLQNIKERIHQSYKTDIEEEKIESEEKDRGEIKERIAGLKEKIERFGTVNLVAIEEHKEATERYAFLSHQQEDLIAAKESLHKVINRINRTIKVSFLETFNRIKDEFKNYFKLLFGGGEADLSLLDETDVLETGIEIVARPPGKRLQNISLLSGGEKALTAIALLFAIFKIKPSPFCILDEIDAPLDEANIDRFTRVLSDFVKTSQFIVVTHNKKTIGVADLMYGVTMEKSGISKIVSVKLKEK